MAPSAGPRQPGINRNIVNIYLLFVSLFLINRLYPLYSRLLLFIHTRSFWRHSGDYTATEKIYSGKLIKFRKSPSLRNLLCYTKREHRATVNRTKNIDYIRNDSFAIHTLKACCASHANLSSASRRGACLSCCRCSFLFSDRRWSRDIKERCEQRSIPTLITDTPDKVFNRMSKSYEQT